MTQKQPDPQDDQVAEQPSKTERDAMEEVQEDAAKERENERGYQ